MSGQSLGLIETLGLTAAVEAADAAMKSANVDLVGYELTKGGGLVTVKLTGEVGAINAAVSAGVAAASRVGSVYASRVIARTAAGIDALISAKETRGIAPRKPAVQVRPPVVAHKEVVIPVIAVEPDMTVADQQAQPEETQPVDAKPKTEAVTPAKPDPLVETVPAQGKDVTAPDKTLPDARPDQAAPDSKKPPRARTKGTRR
jgi:microcompartment protein CcmL/EutN